MIAYASRTGTKRNLDALRAAGWRLLVSARGVLRNEGFGYALDNGAWTAFQRDEPFDVAAFEKALKQLGAGADWIVLPDIVMGGLPSLELSLSWLRRVRRRKALREATFLIAVQNGMEDPKVMRRIARWLGPKCGVFVGGDTDWKLATMPIWARLAHSRGAICHVGRVNTARRIRICEAAGVDSFDGTSASRFAITLRPLELARQQIDLEGYLARKAA
ncbi:hypothetical protein [Sphingobium sp.]|uniref:hypothetical protein n=1 Tax=Sphingobium sp. TaxID=1912891 RepID=UPI0026065370|nr:hypothetical protein [Sphingobium sp.]